MLLVKRWLMGLGLVLLSSCGNGQERSVLVMGTDANFPPFEYVEKGEITGFSVELGKLLAAKLGRELRVENIDFPSLLLAVNTGKVDFAIASITITPERSQQFKFTDPYFKSVQAILVNRQATKIQKTEDLVGKKIGVQLGTTGHLFVQDVENATVVTFDAAATAVMDLRNRKLDAVVVDRDVAMKLAQNYPAVQVLEVPFIDEEYGIAVAKQNLELWESLNVALAELRSSGEYQRLVERYFPANHRGE